MMNFKWMNILVVILYADQNFVTEGRCTNGEVSPDPSDKTCKRYFLCSNGRLVEQQCLNNFVFSKTTRTCVPTSSAYNDCYRNPYAAPKTTKRVIAVYTTRRPKTTTYKTYPRCKEGETRPHPHDCKSYYVCSYHAWIPRVCPKQNVYSKTVGKCVMSYSPYDYCSKTMYKRTTATTTRETYRMTTTTPVYTTTKYRTTTYKHYQRCKEGETRPHYKDCKSYFICSYNVWNPKTCPKHNVYSKTVGKCVMSHSPYDYCSKSTYKRTTTTPVYTTSRYRTTTSRYKTTTSRYRTTTPRYRTTTPRYRITTPRYRITTPRYRITTPRYRITTPRYRITTPRYRITTPRYRITTPRYRTTTRKYYPKCKEGETRPHPQDCKSYYVCSYYAWVPKVCPHKNVYSKTVGKCVMSYSPFDHCSKTSYKRMTSTTTEYPDYIERTSTTESCTSGETYPVRNNCYRYYYCSNGIMQQRTCVFDFVYSRRIKRCVPRHSKHADCKT